MRKIFKIKAITGKTFKITVDKPGKSCYYNNTNFRINNLQKKVFKTKVKVEEMEKNGKMKGVDHYEVREGKA